MDTFANISEPDILKSTSSLAVDTLEGISTNDDIAQSSTILENKDVASRSSVCIRIARVSAIELLVAEVLGARDGGSSREGDKCCQPGL